MLVLGESNVWALTLTLGVCFRIAAGVITRQGVAPGNLLAWVLPVAVHPGLLDQEATNASRAERDKPGYGCKTRKVP